ncbi:hypothetical protein HY251_22285, partial [bacterium]|nr:hypothetical protein [bacterium]
MPMVETPALPREVGSKLARVRWRLRGVALALAGERTVLALGAACVLSFLLDKGLEPELGELAVMRTLTLFLFGSAVAAGAVFGVLALRRHLNDDAVAVLVEREFPELEDGLVSSVQLARDLERGGLGHTSPALIRSTIARTAQKARDLDFDRVIDASPLLLPSFLTLLAVVSGALFASQPPTQQFAQAWFERCVLGRDVRYPKTVELLVVVPGEIKGEAAVARGDDVTVEITITRGAWKVDRPLVKTYALRKDEASGLLELADKEPERTRPAQVGAASAGHYRKIY